MFSVTKNPFPACTVPKGSKVIIYGYKDVGRAYERFLLLSHYAQIVAITDKNYSLLSAANKSVKICRNDEILNYEFDYVVIASYNYCFDIAEYLLKLGVSYEKIVYPEFKPDKNLYSLGIRKVFSKFAETAAWSVDYFKRMKRFMDDKKKYENLNTRPEFSVDEERLLPCINDWDASAAALGSYFYQDLWVAKKIHASGAERHFDIGSRVDGFISSLLAFTKVTLMDIRPLNIDVEGLNFLQADATNLENVADNSIMSLSALCSLEHFGLGRYGDPVDPEACFKAFKAMQQKMRGGGRLYISVPVAERDSVEFNAHRIFSTQTVIGAFDQMELVEFAVVMSGRLITNAIENKSWQRKFNYYRVGLFEFRKS